MRLAPKPNEMSSAGQGSGATANVRLLTCADVQPESASGPIRPSATLQLMSALGIFRTKAFFAANDCSPPLAALQMTSAIGP